MPETLEMQQKREKITKYAKIGGALALGFVVAPIVYTAITGLIGLAAAAAIVVVGVNVAPVFAAKLANWRMKAIMREAQKNPIATMRSIYVDNMRTINEKDQKIKEFEARLGDFKDRMDVFVKKYPEEAGRYKEAAEKMSALLLRQKAKQKQAKKAAQDYNAQISKAEAIYEMSCAANEVTKLAGTVEKQVFDEIKKQVAFDSVNHQFNLAVAELSAEADTDPDFGPVQHADLALKLKTSTGSTATSDLEESRQS